MAGVKTSQANRALSLVGSDPITDYTQNVPRAIEVRAHFDPVTKMLQRQYRWNFMSARATISKDAVAPVHGYLYAYTLPANCLRPWYVDNQNSYDWSRESRKLLTDNPGPINLRYGKYKENPGDWDDLFAELHVCKLALRIGPKVARDRSYIENVREILNDIRGLPEDIDAAEKHGDEPDTVKTAAEEQAHYPILTAYET